MSDACTADIENVSIGLANATIDVSMALKDCAGSGKKFNCDKDVLNAVRSITKCGLAIASAVKDC